MDLRPWSILLAVVVGNCGFWLFLFNRINATGLGRTWSKFFERLFIFLCFGIPAAIAIAEGPVIWEWLSTSSEYWPQATWFRGYGAWCCASVVGLGVSWLESRLWLLPPKHLLETQESSFHVDRSIEGGSPGNRITRLLNTLPGNEIGHIAANTKQLQLPRAVAGADGIRIGHLSDLHFTGQLRREHYEYVFDRLQELEPELIVLSGDVIDYDKCLDWLEPLCGRLKAPHGVTFVLGNHDRRVADVTEVSRRLESGGLHDLGKEPLSLRIRGASIELVGNELPWLCRHEPTPHPSSANQVAPVSSAAEDLLRIAVSHSPDQIQWARQLGIDLMLAGHTHGGQVRIPGIGPIVSPSSYGSRFASGVFYLNPTLMHVSRGVAGTHPLRWRCKPEVSVLVLRNP